MDTKFDHELFKVFQESEKTKEASWKVLKERILKITNDLKDKKSKKKSGRDGTER